MLLQQLRQFIVPLVVLLFAGRRGGSEGWWELAPLLGVGALVLVSVLQYFTYRYRVGRDGITIRSGPLTTGRWVFTVAMTAASRSWISGWSARYQEAP